MTTFPHSTLLVQANTISCLDHCNRLLADLAASPFPEHSLRPIAQSDPVNNIHRMKSPLGSRACDGSHLSHRESQNPFKSFRALHGLAPVHSDPTIDSATSASSVSLKRQGHSRSRTLHWHSLAWNSPWPDFIVTLSFAPSANSLRHVCLREAPLLATLSTITNPYSWPNLSYSSPCFIF